MAIETDKRTRLTIDVPPDVKHRLRLAAIRRDISLRQYVLETLEKRLTEDEPISSRDNALLALSAAADPVLAELWDNDRDAAYDRL